MRSTISSRSTEVAAITDVLSDFVCRLSYSDDFDICLFRIDARVVQYELVNDLYTGENSCLEVTNFTHRGMQRKDNASAVGECALFVF